MSHNETDPNLVNQNDLDIPIESMAIGNMGDMGNTNI